MILVDSSVALKWLKSQNEPHRKKAVLLLERHLKGETRIIAPSLLFIEIANALSTKTATKPNIIRADLRTLYDIDPGVYQETPDDVISSALQARKKKTSVYDMLYAVIARRLGVELITADEQFVRRAKFAHVKLLSEYT